MQYGKTGLLSNNINVSNKKGIGHQGSGNNNNAVNLLLSPSQVGVCHSKLLYLHKSQTTLQMMRTQEAPQQRARVQYDQLQDKIGDDSQGDNYFNNKRDHSVKSGRDWVGGADFHCKYVNT